jgi:cytochrome c5
MGASQSPSANSSKADSGGAQQITLPKIPGEVLPGPNLQVYEKDCLLCHSARYVSMQPRFSKTVWQAEVKKMVDAYGATISDADQAMIVEYLVAVRGSETPASAATPAK